MSLKRAFAVTGTGWLLISVCHLLAAALGILTSITTFTGTGLSGAMIRIFVIAAGLTVPAMWCAFVAGAVHLLLASRWSRAAVTLVLTAGIWWLFGFRGAALTMLAGSVVLAALLASSWSEVAERDSRPVLHVRVMSGLGWIATTVAICVGVAAALLAIGSNDYLDTLVGRALTFSLTIGVVTLPLMMLAGLVVAGSLASRRG